MNNRNIASYVAALAALVTAELGEQAIAQEFIHKAPTAADFAALAKLPDFNGVWERGGGGGGGGQRANQGAAAAPAAGQLATPAAAGGRGGGGQGRGAGGRGGP